MGMGGGTFVSLARRGFHIDTELNLISFPLMQHVQGNSPGPRHGEAEIAYMLVTLLTTDQSRFYWLHPVRRHISNGCYVCPQTWEATLSAKQKHPYYHLFIKPRFSRLHKYLNSGRLCMRQNRTGAAHNEQ